MKFEKLYGPSNTVVKVDFDANDQLTAEAGAMISMSSSLDMQTTTHKKGKRGILKALKRMLAGESFFMNHYTARESNSHVLLSSGLPGDIEIINLNHNKIIVQATSFLAADSQINIETGWQGFKNIFSGESLFWIHLQGQGLVALSAFGSIYSVDVDGEYIVDTGHIVAFDEGLSFKLSKAGSSWLHSVMGSEGIICRFQGKGKIYCQSHNPTAFGYALSHSLRPKEG